jgi:hypothetical protein
MKSFAFVPVALALAAAFTLMPACAAADGSEGEGEGEGEADTCVANDNTDCGLCLQDNCCEALQACEGDADCTACVSGENGDVCESSEDTHARVLAYLECRGGPCQETCIGAATGECRAPLEAAGTAEACIVCLETSCCDEVAACNSNTVCWDGCFFNHVEATCHGDADAHALYHGLGECYTNADCAAACGG